MLPGHISELKPTSNVCSLCECPGELFDIVDLSIAQCNVKYIKYSTFFIFLYLPSKFRGIYILEIYKKPPY